jgi:hypothetical protein
LSAKGPTNAAVLNPNITEATRTAEITSISWSGPTGIVDGIAGAQRLTGQVLDIDKSIAVKVVLRPGDGGRTTVSGQVVIQIGGGGTTTSPDMRSGLSFSSLTLATTDPSGAAVVTGLQPIAAPSQGAPLSQVGPPIAAGILPPGSSGIGMILTTGAIARPVIVSKRLNDGRVIFALKVAGTKAPDTGKASISAITWTNADGTKGRADVSRQQG